jgi:C4-dicarboxylate-specific signal transduction histidine kinase
MLAHELNQPLTAISSYAQGSVRRLAAGAASEPGCAQPGVSGVGTGRLCSQPTAVQDLLAALEQISAEAGRASQIIAALRRFLRRHEPAAVPTDLNELVREAARLIAPDARHRGVELRLTLAVDLPAIQVDRVHIVQVLVNLMRNGLEAMEETPPARCRLSVRTAQPAGDAVEVCVQDYGAGLEAAALERVFEPFYTTKPQGMGMGLPICRSIVHAHGGRLWGEARPAAGAVFRVRLPILARSS